MLKTFATAMGMLPLGLISAQTAQAEQILALTSNNVIVRVDSDNADAPLTTRSVSGLAGGEVLVALDTRPSTGEVFALSTLGQLYTLNPQTGVVTAVGSPISPLPTGSSFGFDFNPVVDAIRVVTEDAENFRINATTGAILGTDTALSYDAGDINNGATPAVTCVAYTNNFSGASSTTLLGVDTDLDDLLTIGREGGAQSPNTGLLHTLQDIGVNSSAECGLDISPDTGTFFAAFTNASTSTSSLYKIDLGTGKNVTTLGALGSGATIRDITVLKSEATLPTVTITSPSAESVSTRAARVVIRGTASDASGVSAVRYRVVRDGRASSYVNVSGTTSWRFTVSLEEGSQRIEVIALDIFGNQSASDRVTIRRRD